MARNKMSKANGPFIRMLRFNHKGVVTVSTEAVALLTCEGETFNALVDKGDGTFAIVPLKVPAGTVTVNKLVGNGHSSIRICVPPSLAGPYKCDTRYRCVWGSIGDKNNTEGLIVTLNELQDQGWSTSPKGNPKVPAAKQLASREVEDDQ